MSSQKLPQLWQRLLDQMSRSICSSSIDPKQMSPGLFLQMTELPEPSAATWKKLTQDMQLPRKLGQLGCSLVAGDPYKAGPLLIGSVVSAVEFFLDGLRTAGIDKKGGLVNGLRAQVLQQLVDSGFFESMKHLMEATPEQLERCTAAAEAAATAAGGSRGGLAAAAAVAAANLSQQLRIAAVGRVVPGEGDCLGMLQDIAEKLLENFVHFHALCSKPQETVSTLGSLHSAAAHLSVAGMRHISVMLQQHGLQEQQQQQPCLPKGMLSLAYGLAYSAMMAATIRDRFRGQLSPHALLGKGPHFVVWSDMPLLLVTYANILQDKGQLPVVGSMGERSGGGSASTNAASAAAGSSTAGSSSSKMRRQQQPGGRPSRTSTNPKDYLERSAAAWQDVQGQWDRIFSSHKQLLELLGVSPQAAVWLAAIMPRFGSLTIPAAAACWECNPHKVVSAAASGVVNAQSSTASAPVVMDLRAQLQQWDNTPLLESVQLLRLYDAAYAGPGDCFIWSSCIVLATMVDFQRQQLLTAAVQQLQAAASCHLLRALAAAFAPTTQDELLLLLLHLLRRLQQLQGSTSPATASLAADVVFFQSAAARATHLEQAQESGTNILMSLVMQINGCAQLSSLSAAATAAGAASVHDTHPMTGSMGDAPAGSPAAPGSVATGGLPQHCSNLLPAVLVQQAGTLFSILEGSLRLQSCQQATPASLVQLTEGLKVLCGTGLDGNPGLLLRLAQQGTRGQQVAFFNLLVTLLKLSATPAFSGNTGAGSQCRINVSSAATEMLFDSLPDSGDDDDNDAGAAAANLIEGIGAFISSSSSARQQGGSSSDTSGDLWLLLLGRCYQQWAAELAKMAPANGDWVQLIQQAQQQQSLEPTMSLPAALSHFFGGQQCVLPTTTQFVLDTLRGSSSSAGLAAKGFDMGAVLQSFDDVAACYSGLLETDQPGDVVAGNVAGLIKALEDVGSACSVFAVPHCCNNPGCSNLAKAVEQSIVSGKGCKCSGCQVARYCGKACQLAHWKQHKPVCKMLQAAAPQRS